MKPPKAGRRRRLRGRGKVKGRRRLRRFNLRKAMFVLPNLFTVSNLFCGFYAISLCLDSPQPIHLYRAAVAVFFGMFFDMFDGRVARLTKTQSEFGVQLDSLADLITFGCAPAILLYRWSLQDAGFLGLFVAFLFMTGGALRLARFNVLAQHEKGPSKHFVGLPIPLAAGTVVAIVMAAYPFERPSPEESMIITLTLSRHESVSMRVLPGVSMVVCLVLAGLMVSNVRYRTFKEMKLTKKSITLIFVIALITAALSAQLKPALALTALFVGYIAVGLIEEVIFFPKRSRERRERQRMLEPLESDSEAPAESAKPEGDPRSEEPDEAGDHARSTT